MPSAGVITSRSPQAPSEIVWEAPATDPAAVAELAQLARRAGRAWAAEPAISRSSALVRAAQALSSVAGELADLIVREVGKPRAEARAEVSRAVAILHYYAQQVLDPIGETFAPNQPGALFTVKRPRGLAGLITPWNFPLAIPVWKAAPAIAAGNAVLLKPSSEAIGTASRLAGVLAAELPAGLISLAPGERDTAGAVIDEADVVSFTGSTEAGRSVAARAVHRGIPVQAEMGGQNAAIVLPDADPGPTAGMILGAAMGFAGQKCTATRRIIVVGDSAEMRSALGAALDGMRPADPSREDATVGPVISARAKQAVEDAIALAGADGARTVAAGDSEMADGYFVRPTLLEGLPAGHRLLQEETFGPLAAILPARSIGEAVRIANATRYGLVASVHGRDLEAVLRAATALDAGLIKVNAPTTGVDFQLPFGGEKDSSLGPREQGKAGMEFYRSTQTVTLHAPHAMEPEIR